MRRFLLFTREGQTCSAGSGPRSKFCPLPSQFSCQVLISRRSVQGCRSLVRVWKRDWAAMAEPVASRLEGGEVKEVMEEVKPLVGEANYGRHEEGGR